MKTISLNTQYIVLFKNPCVSSQFVYLAKQLYPHNAYFGHEAYVDATKPAYDYLLLDLRSEQDNDLHLRMKIFLASDTSSTCQSERAKMDSQAVRHMQMPADHTANVQTELPIKDVLRAERFFTRPLSDQEDHPWTRRKKVKTLRSLFGLSDKIRQLDRRD